MTSPINYDSFQVQKTMPIQTKRTLKSLYTVYNSTVLVSPYWKQLKTSTPVGYIPTFTGIASPDNASTSFTITDTNAASNYYENIFAISLNGNPGIGNLNVMCGSVNKPWSEIKIPVAGLNSVLINPVIILSPFWKGGPSCVGYSDVITAIDIYGFTITSSNLAPNYYVNYLVINKGITTTTDGPAAEANCINKISTGKMRVYFTQQFTTPPVVFITPWDKNNNSTINSVETVTDITIDYFDFTSTNFGPDYFVNWLAVAPSEG